MDSSTKSDRISDIVKLKRMLKKWRIQASSGSNSSATTTTNNNNVKQGSLSRSNSIKSVSSSSNNVKQRGSLSRGNSIKSANIIISSSNNNNDVKKKGSLSRSNSLKGISFLKRTLSFTDLSSHGVSNNAVPKGFLAVHVGEDMERFVIPTNYLKHQAFCCLLKEAEDEFGFQQEGVLRIPCEVEVFENILRRVEAKNSPYDEQALKFSRNDGIVCGSIESQSISTSHRPPSPMCR